MTIFNTRRLIVKKLVAEDAANFAELFTDPNVLEPIPQAPFSEEQIAARFDHSLALSLEDLYDQKCAFGIYEDGKSELIGLALFLLNNSNGFELGYRFRAKYWGKGFGTEITMGMLAYYFDELRAEMVTADVNVANTASVKILEKFMSLEKEFFNPRDNCFDRTYTLRRSDWYAKENVKTVSFEVRNSELNDLKAIFDLYRTATAYMKSKNQVAWPEFSQEMVSNEIRSLNQWKLLIDGRIACIWATALNDELIWGRSNNEPSLYLHRIATHPDFRGQKLVERLLEWADKYGHDNQLSYLRMDTVGLNQGLISHYQSLGFEFLGTKTLEDVSDLPGHYKEGPVCLFQKEVKKA